MTMQSPTLAAIWAQSAHGIIGADYDTSWEMPEDMAYLKAATTRHPVIMGRRA